MRKVFYLLFFVGLSIFPKDVFAGKQWNELTPQEQSQVLDLTNSCRSYAKELAQLANLGDGVGSAWDGGTATVVNSLDSTAVIPNTTSLAGAQDLSPADVTNMAGYAIDLSNPANNQSGGGYNTAFHRALDVKMTGIINTVGQ